MSKYYWGGFCDGKLHHTLMNDGFGGSNVRLVPSIFLTKRHASEQYEDVRKIQITDSKVQEEK